jgi:hypothetical protein
LIFREEEMSTRGLENIRQALGKPLTRARRCVFWLGCANDAFGHGITELTFEDAQIVIRPGPNEDYLVVDTGPLDPSGLEPEYWTEVDLVRDYGWQLSGYLKHIIGRELELFGTDPNKVAPVFRARIAA